MHVDSQVCIRPVRVQDVVIFGYRTGIDVQLRGGHGFYHPTVAVKVDNHDVVVNVMQKKAIKLKTNGTARIMHAYL